MKSAPTITVKLVEALDYARCQHGTQVRKGTQTPYLTHLLAVAALVGEQGGTEDEMIGALLHDVVEDCGGRPRLIEVHERYGPNVSQIVEGCSDSYSEDPMNKPPWRERKERYLNHLEQASDSVRLVSLCDKLHNLTTLIDDLEVEGPSTLSRFNAKGSEQLWFFREFDLIVRKSCRWPAVRRFSHAVERLEALLGAFGD